MYVCIYVRMFIHIYQLQVDTILKWALIMVPFVLGLSGYHLRCAGASGYQFNVGTKFKRAQLKLTLHTLLHEATAKSTYTSLH